jgi:hypothetical protein
MRTNRMTMATLGMLLGYGPLLAQYIPYQQTQTAPAPMPMASSSIYPSTGAPPMAQPPSSIYPSTGAPKAGAPEAMPSQPYAFPYQAQPGAAEMPWCGSSPAGGGNSVGGCNGPVGANGPITYEIYLRTGPNLLAGAGAFNGTLDNGWTVQGGGRTLFFNTERDAAWVIDLGLGYTRNTGFGLSSPVFVSPSSLKFGSVGDNTPQAFGIRFLNRSSFNYGIGRDWFLNGPGALGEEHFGNWRFGTDVGGRYGSASIGFDPASDPGGSRRRQGIFHGVYLGTGLNWEKPFGGTMLFAGVRAEWGYTWTNLLPPNDSNISDVNLLMTFGIRF